MRLDSNSKGFTLVRNIVEEADLSHNGKMPWDVLSLGDFLDGEADLKRVQRVQGRLFDLSGQSVYPDEKQEHGRLANDAGQ